MKTYIAIPCMDSVTTPFFRSYAYMRTVGECGLGTTQGTLVYDGRNQLSAEAIAGGFDYVLWLDSDMEFGEDLMERLFDSIGDKDFMSGLYFTRRQSIKPCIFDNAAAAVKDGEVLPLVTNYFEYPKDSIFEIAACGFGAVLMKTKMLADVTEAMGLPFSPAYGFGEDLSFCLRARQLGYKLWCDSRIKLDHGMYTVSNEALYLSQQGKTP